MPFLSRPAPAWKAFLSVSAILWAAGLLVAQQAPTVVDVPATVRDGQGHIVHNLNKDDFIVEEDGRPQTIRSLTPGADRPLSLGMLVDTSRDQSQAIGQEKKATGSFANNALREGKDTSFLIHFDHEVDLLQDLTTSREKTVSALDKLQPAQDRQQGGSRPSGRHGAGSSQGGVLYDAIFLASDELLQKQPGRKAIIVLTDGVNHGSKVTLERAIESAQRANTIIYAIFVPPGKSVGEGWDRNVGQGPGYGPPWDRGGYPGGGYPGGGYPGGGYPGGGSPSGRTEPTQPQTSPEEAKIILDRLSRETGGRMFEVSKKEPLDQIYKQIEDELRNQYDLGFTSDRAADPSSDLRRIRVTVKQKDLTVQAPEGYYPAKPANAH